MAAKGTVHVCRLCDELYGKNIVLHSWWQCFIHLWKEHKPWRIRRREGR